MITCLNVKKTLTLKLVIKSKLKHEHVTNNKQNKEHIVFQSKTCYFVAYVGGIDIFVTIAELSDAPLRAVS